MGKRGGGARHRLGGQRPVGDGGEVGKTAAAMGMSPTLKRSGARGRRSPRVETTWRGGTREIWSSTAAQNLLPKECERIGACVNRRF